MRMPGSIETVDVSVLANLSPKIIIIIVPGNIPI